jgi:hypothetical protein
MPTPIGIVHYELVITALLAAARKSLTLHGKGDVEAITDPETN